MDLCSSSHVTPQPAELGDGELPSADFAQEHPLRILIADDNYINRRVLSLLLQRLGYETKTTENGRDCLDAALRNPCDLLLIDIDMPEMSGIECTQQIREAKLDFPIVAVTATAPELSQEKCFAAGMTGFMAKPVRLQELKQILRVASDTRRKKAEGTSPIVA
jgi:CheY-like chemotaxis protein